MKDNFGFVDLHIHTTASDGACSPSEVVRMALERNQLAIAITDHDTLGGIAEALQTAKNTGLEVIAGVEISSEGEWGDLHFLGYFVDPENELLVSRLAAMRASRVERARKMVARLASMGMPLEWERVQALAAGGTLGRPHIALALEERGYVATISEAFERFIRSDGPAYFPRLKLSPAEVIATIRQAGGVPVLAHPFHSGAAAVRRIPEFVEYGLRGLEVYHPAHSPDDSTALLEMCRTYDLIATGGSDFHFPSQGGGIHERAELGSMRVPWECVKRLKAEVRRYVESAQDLQVLSPATHMARSGD